MSAAVATENKRIHPHKFTMWVAMGSIVMMFAGLTSAYVVRRNQGNWQEFNLPLEFWYSTAVILASSVTMYLSEKAFKSREMARYRTLITVTAVLGVLFAVLQGFGFADLHGQGIKLVKGSNPAAAFLVIITGLHALHVLGGVVALLIFFIRAYSSKLKNYSSVPVEVLATYWHFVDVLWIYLFMFFGFTH
jgi:cytochrome c oxidase subunit 3